MATRLGLLNFDQLQEGSEYEVLDADGEQCLVLISRVRYKIESQHVIQACLRHRRLLLRYQPSSQAKA